METDPQRLLQGVLSHAGPVVREVRQAFPHLLALYAFGSRMRGLARADSDLDLAVLVAGYADKLQLWALMGALADRLGCDVDVCDLREVSTVMQYQIITTGQTLWVQQPQAGFFECFIFSEKHNLDAARASLLAQILQDGKIYGR